MFHVPLKFLGGGYSAYRHVRALIIVSPEPLGGRCLGLIDAHKHVLIKPVISDCSIIALHISILLRVSGLDEHERNAVFLGPFGQGIADIFRAIVTADRFRFSAPLNDLIKGSDNTQGRQRDSTAKPSLLKSSMTLKVLKLRPSDSWACIKSIDQVRFAASGTVKAAGVSRFSRRLGLMRRFRASSQ